MPLLWSVEDWGTALDGIVAAGELHRLNQEKPMNQVSTGLSSSENVRPISRANETATQTLSHARDLQQRLANTCQRLIQGHPTSGKEVAVDPPHEVVPELVDLQRTLDELAAVLNQITEHTICLESL